jgi:signal transduction histidine kinase
LSSICFINWEYEFSGNLNLLFKIYLTDFGGSVGGVREHVEMKKKGKEKKIFIIFLKNINADEGRYTQILLNFLSNSFKFTPPGGKITVEVLPIDQEFY